MANYLDKLIGAESAGDPNAHNTTKDAKGKLVSDALGLGQFIPDTWVSMLQKHRPDVIAGVDLNDPAQRAAVLEKRRDPALSRAMAAAYTSDNEAAWAKAGVADVTDGMRYMGHFLGTGGALNAFKADPNEPVLDFLKRTYPKNWEAVYQGNLAVFQKGLNGSPVLTVGDVRRWAEMKMGNETAPMVPAAAASAPTAPGGPCRMPRASPPSRFPTR